MKKLWIFLFFPVLCFALTDAEYERRLHNIYVKHYKEPISYQDWNNQIQNLAKKYQLKHRDNMWDLSDNFFQNPLYWSKIWMLNPQVENPHRIYKGDSLKLDLVSLSKVTKAKQGVDLKELFPNINIPASRSRSALKESEIPSSLPEINLLTGINKVFSEIDFSKLDFFLPVKKAPVGFYLSDSVPSKDGKIISHNGYGKRFGVTGETIVIRLNQSASIGTYFTVFKNRGRPRGILPAFIRRNEYEIQVKGILKISSYVQGSGLLYRAQVMSALDSLDRKDSLFKGLPPAYSFSSQKKGTGKGRIIGSPYKQRLFLTSGSLVYLDQGTADGVFTSDSFYIQAKKTEESKFFKRPYHQELSQIGQLKVVASTPNRSTAVIINARDKIYVGDAWTGALKGIEVESVEDWEGFQESNLLQDYEEVEDIKADFPEKPKDSELAEEFADPQTENLLGPDFEIQSQPSQGEIDLEGQETDTALKEQFNIEGSFDPEDFEVILEEDTDIGREEVPSDQLKDLEEIDIY